MTSAPGTAATTAVTVLFERWRRDHDQRARDQLVERFLPLAHKLARRYARAGEPYEDLVQVASLGLVKAVERFDPARESAFASFAVPTILGELKRYFRDCGWGVHVERGAQEHAQRITAAQQAISAHTGRAPTVDELSQYLECSDEEVLDGLQALEAYEALSLDAPPGETDRKHSPTRMSRLEVIGGCDEQLELVDQSSTVFAAARELPQLERQLLYLRFGEDLAQTEIARRMGISQMQVSRLLHRSLQQLRCATDGRPSV